MQSIDEKENDEKRTFIHITIVVNLSIKQKRENLGPSRLLRFTYSAVTNVMRIR